MDCLIIIIQFINMIWLPISYLDNLGLAFHNNLYYKDALKSDYFALQLIYKYLIKALTMIIRIIVKHIIIEVIINIF